MAYNLIEQEWITVKTSSGKRMRIAPWQITMDYGKDPIAFLDMPRPDFNGALIQFLIGLLQTTYAPANKKEWQARLDDPPSPKELHGPFSAIAHAFDLDGDGPRFMQDHTISEDTIFSMWNLLLDAPRSDFPETSRFIFVRGADLYLFCKPCAAAALYCLQSNSPKGGRGHLVGMRGGGPLTTINASIRPDLWRSSWANVLTKKEFGEALRVTAPGENAPIFGWLSEAGFKSDAKGSTILDFDPLHVFWTTPRRIKLDFKTTHSHVCGLCGTPDDHLLSVYFTRPHGIKYTGLWPHPLSPRYWNKDGTSSPILCKPDHMLYRNWLGIAMQFDGNNKEGIRPAIVIDQTRKKLSKKQAENQFKVWSFGFHMRDIIPQCWYEGSMPLIVIEDHLMDDFVRVVSEAINMANSISYNLGSSLKRALTKEVTVGQGASADTLAQKGFKGTSLSNSADLRFWTSTESEFYNTLEKTKVFVEAGESCADALKDWHRILADRSLAIFDEIAASGAIEDEDPRRISLARLQLINFNYSKKLMERLKNL